MNTSRLHTALIAQTVALMELGAPYIRARPSSDYWLYATLFSSTCPVALDGDTLAGIIIALRSQDDPEDVYIQDVMIHPDYRRRGLAGELLGEVRDRALAWGCRRLYLTSEPENDAARATWGALGFYPLSGGHVVSGVPVVADFKGPGKDRAVYQLDL